MKERKRKLKPFVMPMVYALAFTALVLSLSVVDTIQNKQVSKADDNYTYVNNSIISSNVPVVKEETIEVKVIAVDKKKEDREVKLSINRSAIPGIGVVCKLNNDRLIIKAGKKEAKATITLFPGKAIKGEIIQIVCTPLWEGGQTSKMSIELIPK